MTRHYLMLPGDPSLRARLDHHVDAVVRATGLAGYDVRQSLMRPGPSLLGSMEPAAARRAAEALSAAGYGAAILERTQITGVERPRRVVAASVAEGRAALLDLRGEEVLAIDGSSRVLLVAADLDADPLAASRARSRSADPTEALRELSRGYAVLRVFVEGLERSALIVSGRFNYRSLGERASVSAALNFQILVDALMDCAGEARLDMDFPLADRPPIRVALARDEQHPRLEPFEVHARVARALWLCGASAPPPLVPPDPDPVPDERATAEAAARVMADPERRRSDWRDRLRQLGPLWLYALCGIIALGLIALVLPEGPTESLAILALSSSPLLLYSGLRALLEQREIEDYPTSRARSVAMGKVELSGRTASAVPLRAPWSGVACVWYRWTRQELFVDAEGKKRWRTTGRGDSGDLPFVLEDDTGRVMIDPAGAEVITGRRSTISGSYVSFQGGAPISMPMGRDVRVIEQTLPAGRPIYVLGTARPLRRRGDDRRGALRERLRALKADPERLMAFDADGDGHIDPEEWATAVASVERELLARGLDAAGGEGEGIGAVIGRGEGSRFLISDRSEGELLRGLRLRAAAGLLGGLAAAGAGTWGLLSP